MGNDFLTSIVHVQNKNPRDLANGKENNNKKKLENVKSDQLKEKLRGEYRIKDREAIIKMATEKTNG